ncbi:Asp23/Gls24 family envelope stress response protein [Pseudonocardia alni]|uniref:Asp23/Gls24 family envelope stress response protein n=1 Tax=Pseudonocardia alni TaxID=33907 RepID=UPI0033E9090C
MTGPEHDRPGPGGPDSDDGHFALRPDLLPCARSRDEVLDQVARGDAATLDPHQDECVHCRAALAEYDRLWSPMRELAAERVEIPEAGIEAALARLRGAIEDTDYATLRGPQGTTRVAARVVVVAARHSAQEVPGVRVALSRELTGPHDTDSEVHVGVAGTSTVIEITLAADYGRSLHQLAADVRSAVTDRVRHLTDLDPVQVVVIIDDVLG